MTPRCAACPPLMAALLVAALLLAGCEKKTDAKPPAAPAAAPVVVAPALKRDVPVTVEAIAAAKAFSIINVRPQLAGMVTEKHFIAGQFVNKDQVLYRLDTRALKAELVTAEANLAHHQALAQHADNEATRKTELLQRNAASQYEVDQAVTAAKAAAAPVEADRARAEEIKVQIGYCEIRSPVDGFLGPTLIDLGNVVKENDSLMITIRQISPIYVEMTVPQQHLTTVRAAMREAEAQRKKLAAARGGPPMTPMEEAIAGPAVPFHVTIADVPGEAPIVGKLLFMNNTVDEETGTLTLRGVFLNKDHKLWPGQYLRGSVTLGVKKDAVLVPTAALQNSQEGSFVFVVKPDQTVEMRPVVVGDVIAGRELLIEKGLSGGETVVVEGQLRLVPGAKVAVKNAGNATTSKRAQAK